MGGSNNVTIGPVPDAQNDGVQVAPINLAASGTIVAPVAGKRIFVHGLFLTLNAAGTIQFQDVSGSATVNLTPAISLALGTPLELGWQNYPWLTCGVGDALVGVIATATQVSGRIMYTQDRKSVV